MQKLTPLFGQPPALMKVCQTSAFDAFVLVARIAIVTMKKNSLLWECYQYGSGDIVGPRRSLHMQNSSQSLPQGKKFLQYRCPDCVHTTQKDHH
jgi:hypothetical protein